MSSHPVYIGSHPVYIAITGTRFFVGSGNWNDTAHWSTTDGGSTGAAVPSSNDDVYFTNNSGACNVDVPGGPGINYCYSVNIASTYANNITWANGSADALQFIISTDFIVAMGYMGTLNMGSGCNFSMRDFIAGDTIGSDSATVSVTTIGGMTWYVDRDFILPFSAAYPTQAATWYGLNLRMTAGTRDSYVTYSPAFSSDDTGITLTCASSTYKVICNSTFKMYYLHVISGTAELQNENYDFKIITVEYGATLRLSATLVGYSDINLRNHLTNNGTIVIPGGVDIRFYSIAMALSFNETWDFGILSGYITEIQWKEDSSHTLTLAATGSTSSTPLWIDILYTLHTNFTNGQYFKLNNIGAVASHVVLRSDSTGAQWYWILADPSFVGNHLDIKDCNASLGPQVNALLTNSNIDSGNNINIKFT